MCGIVALFNSKGVTGKTLFELALSNKHRGDDGVGFAYRDESSGRILIRRLPFTLEELANGELDRERAKRKITIGVVSYLDVDEELYTEMNRRFKTSISKILNRKYDFAILHHRGASVGDASPKNIHPVIVDKKLYFHNGTVYGTELLRTFMEKYFDVKFKSETDTEVLAYYINMLSQKGANPFELLDSVDAGVFIETDGRDINIYRTPSRRIWLVKSKLGDFLISEINPKVIEILKPSEILLLTTGHHNLSIMKTVDYTKEAYELYKIYSNAKEYDIYKTCSICNKDKLAIYDSSDYKKKCFECALFNELKEPRKATYSTPLSRWC